MQLECNDIADLFTISALVQDAITCLQWFYLTNDVLTVMLNRFRWEVAERFPSRVNSLLTIHSAHNCLFRNFNNSTFKNVLGILETKQGSLRLVMSNTTEVDVPVISTKIYLDDIGIPYPANKPTEHQFYLNDFG